MNILVYLQDNPVALTTCVFVFGLIVGSFLNVVIYRLPVMMQRDWRSQCRELFDEPLTEALPKGRFDLVVPRSRCRNCNQQIHTLQNIPVISFMLMRGRCASCGESISLRYPLVELIGGILAAAVSWKFGFSMQTLYAILFTWALISLTFIDFDTTFLPDSITLPFLWLGLIANASNTFTTLRSAVFGAIAGYLILWTVYQMFKLVTGKKGLGFGDFKLLAMLGAWLGWQALPIVIVLSSVVGATVGLALITFRGQARDVPIPFGPYLASAGWIALIWGNQITDSYLRWATPG